MTSAKTSCCLSNEHCAMQKPEKCLVNVIHFEHLDTLYLDNGFLQNCLEACLVLTYSTDITNTALNLRFSISEF